MSLGKVSQVGSLGKDFDGLTPDEIKKKIIQKFSEAYGRYENVSGKMWAEIYHNEGDKTEGEVIWRKGIGNEITEDIILTHPKAILRFMELVYKGYTLDFKAVTQSDIDKGNELRKLRQTAPEREGWLGKYVNGNRFFSISTFKRDEYYIEYGYDGVTTRAWNENEGGARFELDMALAGGFTRECDADEGFVNPLEAFGLELDTIEAEEEAVRKEAKSHETADGELPDDFFDMMR